MVMVYPSYAFSKNNRSTIVRKDGSTFGAQREKLSQADIRGINKMYPTPEFRPDPNKWYRITSRARLDRGLHVSYQSYGRGRYVITHPFKGYAS